MLKVLFLTPEATPFAKTGGLADVSGSLPQALKSMGTDIRMALPYYRVIDEGSFEVKALFENIETAVGRDRPKADIFLTKMNGDIPVYLIKRDEYFGRRYLYGTPKGDYFDNLERFVFFSKAVLLLCEMLDFQPDIIHCNDWQTGLVPAYLKTLFKNKDPFRRVASLFIIHNIAYQGLFDGEKCDITGLPTDLFNPEGIEFWGKINLLKSGIVFSDLISTVSRKYSQEIQTPEFGYGLDGVLRSRKRDLFGIVNGVDYTEWNPKTDPLIAANYDATDLSGKAKCKEDLLREFNLPRKFMSKPIIGVISRLVKQKGFELVSEIIDALMRKDIGFVILGTGESEYETIFTRIGEQYPKKSGVRIAYDNPLAHKIEAGADMFLMPSRYEPCGLNQIYSLKYGTVPVVRATGGLDDTIVDYHTNPGRATGFKFNQYRGENLLKCIDEALSVYHSREKWGKLMLRGMKTDFSWEKSAKEYLRLYQRASTKARDPHERPRRVDSILS